MKAWRGVIEEYRDFLPITDKTPIVTLFENLRCFRRCAIDYLNLPALLIRMKSSDQNLFGIRRPLQSECIPSSTPLAEVHFARLSAVGSNQEHGRVDRIVACDSSCEGTCRNKAAGVVRQGQLPG